MELLPKQREFIADCQSPIIAYIGGFGSGKTLSGCIKALALSALNPNCAGMMVSPTYPMLRDTTRRTFIDLLNAESIGFSFKATENKILIHESNSEIWFRSGDDPAKLKGSNLAWVMLDEAASMSREAFDESIARVRDPKAKYLQRIITTTPEGFNWVYDLSDKIRIIKSSTAENTYLPKEYIQTLYDQYDELLIKQYIEGEFVNITAAAVYHAFNRKVQVKSLEVNPDFPLYVAVDFNVSPMAWVIIQQIGNVTYCVDEIVVKNTNTEAQSHHLKERYSVSAIYGDYAGNQRHTSSSYTDYEIMRQVLGNVPLKLKPNPIVIDRVNSVNARLKNANGAVNLYISDKCKHLIRDLEQVTYKHNRREIDKSHAELTHISDALGYYIEYEYPIKPKTKVYHNF